MIVINDNYEDPSKKIIEIVERKGVGHPDTLADALAEELSRIYSKYCLDNFGAVLHHNLDKLYVGAGWNTNSFGTVNRIKPIRIMVNGRISTSYCGKSIDIDTMFTQVIKEYIGTVLPHIDVDNDLEILINPTQYTRVPHWFSPRSIDDVPDAKAVFANDTSVVTSFYPYTLCEKLAIELESFFWIPNDKGYPVPKYCEIGQDIKVMVVRDHADVTVIVCMPVISTEIKTREDYYRIVTQYQELLKKEAERIVHGTSYNVKVHVNAGLDDDTKGTIYMLALGTSAECGEEGLVGRGNSSRGTISTFRPNSMEAPAGKNPRYHTGRVLSFLGNRLTKKIYEITGVKNSVVFLTRNKHSLIPPYMIYVSLEEDVDHKVIEEIINSEVNIKEYTTEILVHRNLF